MRKLLGGLGGFGGSWLGWALGAHLSLSLAFVLGTVGMGLGTYYGRKAAREYF